MIIPIFTPHGGCPERCNFCDQHTSGGVPVAQKKIIETIESHLKTAPKASAVAFYGGTFTAMPKPTQLAYLDAVKPYLRSKLVESVRIATRPDAIDREWIEKLAHEYSVQTLELGVQSFNSEVLKALGRSHTLEHVERASTILRDLKLEFGFHLMIGCPAEDPERDDALTLRFLEKLRPHLVRIHPLLILRGTGLEQPWKKGSFTPLSLETAVARTARLTQNIESMGIKVIRLGLQPNENLGQAVLAGPFHPAFGELVRARIYRNQLENRILASEPRTGGLEIEVLAPERALSAVRGQKKANLAWLKERFNLSSIEARVLKERTDFRYAEEDFEIRLHHIGGPAQRG